MGVDGGGRRRKDMIGRGIKDEDSEGEGEDDRGDKGGGR